MKKLLFASVTLFALNSCEKIEIEKPETPTQIKVEGIDLLTDGDLKKWSLVIYTENNISKFDSCAADDIFTFSKSKKEYSWLKNNTPCFDGDVDQVFSFELMPGDSILKINDFNYTVRKLTKDSLIIDTELHNLVVKVGYKAKK
jgi:hypothetical protein